MTPAERLHVERAVAQERADIISGIRSTTWGGSEEIVAMIRNRHGIRAELAQGERGAAQFGSDMLKFIESEWGDAWEAGATAMREACAQRAEAEEEPGDTVPPHVYEHLIEVGPFSAAKGAVRATKKAIAKGIRALPIPARPK